MNTLIAIFRPVTRAEPPAGEQKPRSASDADKQAERSRPLGGNPQVQLPSQGFRPFPRNPTVTLWWAAGDTLITQRLLKRCPN